MDCCLPGSSVHWILQAGILKWVVISFSRGSSEPRDWTWVSRIAGRFFTIWAIREAQAFLFFLILIFLIFNWRIIALQYCASFCCTTTWISYCCCLATKLCLTLCNPWDCSKPGSFVLHNLPVCSDSCSLSQWCYLTILLPPSPLAFSPSQPQSLFWSKSALCFRWARVLELQHQSFQWTFRVDFL